MVGTWLCDLFLHQLEVFKINSHNENLTKSDLRLFEELTAQFQDFLRANKSILDFPTGEENDNFDDDDDRDDDRDDGDGDDDDDRDDDDDDDDDRDDDDDDDCGDDDDDDDGDDVDHNHDYSGDDDYHFTITLITSSFVHQILCTTCCM